ncbi:hypothetical protein CANCADRAFT_133108 [Tortispora caseinolytica NRRL Y-17796]|uniref:Uncharacterized protein n=1 Tax=Tortispora caseinolytica NRRL Y-17796 TaxID=767744 RepID=A0A1E4TBK6_9ASCO|nr:hypothetical protein CANCADRAFT_133108 [Tortispora caseinolytica NRRL Y-17796]
MKTVNKSSETSIKYKETSVDVNETEYNGCLLIQAPPPKYKQSSLTTPWTKPRLYKARTSEVAAVEKNFYDKNIAAESYVYSFPEDSASLHSVSWRLMTDRSVIRLYPYCKSSTSTDSLKYIEIKFPDIIPYHCSSIVDSTSDSCALFALCSNGALYKFIISCTSFSPGVQPDDILDACEIYHPNYFSVRSPAFLFALSEQLLLFPLLDGGLLKLEKPSPNADSFIEISFSDSSYISSFKSLFSWSTSDMIPYYPSVSGNLIISACQSDDGMYIFTFSANYSISLWKTDTGALLDRRSLLQENQKSFVPDVFCSNITGFSNLSGRTFFVVYSALSQRFHFYVLVTNKEGATVLEDMAPSQNISCPIVSAESLWSCVSLSLRPQTGLHDCQLITAWKHGAIRSSIQIATVLYKSGELSLSWSSVLSPFDYDFKCGDLAPTNSYDASQYFIREIFLSSKYSNECVKAALSIMSLHYTGKDSSDIINQAAVDDLIDIASDILNGPVSIKADQRHGTLDYDSYNADINMQWSRFNRLCLELSHVGEELLSLNLPRSSKLNLFVGRGSKVSIVEPAVLLERFCSSSVESLILDEFSETTIIAKRLYDMAHRLRKSLNKESISYLVDYLIDDLASEQELGIRERMSNVRSLALESVIESKECMELRHILINTLELDAIVRTWETIYADAFKPKDYSDRTSSLSTVYSDLSDLIASSHSFILDILLLSLVPQDEALEAPMTSLFSHFSKQLSNISILSYLAMTPAESTTTDITQDMSKLLLSRDSPVGCYNNEMYRPVAALEYFVHSKFTGKSSNLLNASLRPAWALLKDLDIANDALSLHRIGAFFVEQRMFEVFIGLSRFVLMDNVMVVMKFISYLELGMSESAYSLVDIVINAIGFSLELMTVPQRDIIDGLLTDDIRDALKEADENIKCSCLRFEIACMFANRGHCVLGNRLFKECYNSYIELKDGMNDKFLEEWFACSMRIDNFDDAYLAVSNMKGFEKREETLAMFVFAVCEKDSPKKLCDYPFIGVQEEVDRILSARAESDISTADYYYKVLFGFRMVHGDVRRAGEALYLHIQNMRAQFSAADELSGKDVEITQCYLILINTLETLVNEDPWIVVKSLTTRNNGASKRTKGVYGDQALSETRVLTLDDIQNEYSKEISRMEHLLGKRILSQ